MSEHEQNWEQRTIERIALEGLREQRRARRWGIFFKLFFLFYLGTFAWVYFYGGEGGDLSDMRVGDHTAVVRLTGVISEQTQNSSGMIIDSLEKAFKNERAHAVILYINSPGGSPVQSGEVHDAILKLREEYPAKAIYTVVSDICASGGYYIAAATDEIYANRASLIGSIGVVYAGFGFVDTLEKLGIQRRLFTAGKHKGLLDPFSPLEEIEVEHLLVLLDEIHQQFIQVVREGRGDRLKGDDEDLFNGFFWSGERSLELGLVDGLGDLRYVAREVVGKERLVDYTKKRTVLDALLGTAGEAIARGLIRAFPKEGEGGLR